MAWKKVKLEGGFEWVRVMRYRVMSFSKALGPWRESRAEAEADALDARVATRDPHTRRLYLMVPAWIWEAEPCEATEKGLRRRRKRRLIEADPQSSVDIAA